MLWWVGILTARPRTRAFTVSNVKVTNCGLGLNYSTGEHPFQPPRTSQTVFLAVSQQEWELNYPTSLDYCCHLILRLRLAVGPGNVMFQNGDHGELSHSEISGGSRGVWLERNEGLAVHHILIHNNYGPSIDVDNGNNGVLLYSNIMEHTDAYGMWLELSTTDCWVFNNTIRNASFAIVAVSSAGHHFIGNTLLDSKHGTFVFGVAAKGKRSRAIYLRAILSRGIKARTHLAAKVTSRTTGFSEMNLSESWMTLKFMSDTLATVLVGSASLITVISQLRSMVCSASRIASLHRILRSLFLCDWRGVIPTGHQLCQQSLCRSRMYYIAANQNPRFERTVTTLY